MNDGIQYAISSSPISLSDIFDAPTTSALAFVLRTSMRARTFRIFLEPRIVIGFLRLKGLSASAITTELKSVYEREALALSTAKKWRKCFAEGKTRTSLSHDPRCGRRPPNA
jgi:hypothetical protein